MVAVQPETQMVEPMVACVTSGFSAPGVSAGLGSPGSQPMAVAFGFVVAAGDGSAGGAVPVAPSSRSTGTDVAAPPGEGVATGVGARVGVDVGDAVTRATALDPAPGVAEGAGGGEAATTATTSMNTVAAAMTARTLGVSRRPVSHPSAAYSRSNQSPATR